MRIKALIMSETFNEGVGSVSKKPYAMLNVLAIDSGDTERCKSPLEITLANADNDLKGTLQDKIILIDVLSITAAASRLRISGKVVREAAKQAGR